MRSLNSRKYNSLKEFYNAGLKLSEDIKTETTGMSANDRVKFARKNIMQDILNSCINIGILSKEAADILKTSNSIVKFSMDNLIKNIIAHSEMNFEDYEKIPLIAKNPSKIIKSRTDYDVMLFKSRQK